MKRIVAWVLSMVAAQPLNARIERGGGSNRVAVQNRSANLNNTANVNRNANLNQTANVNRNVNVNQNVNVNRNVNVDVHGGTTVVADIRKILIGGRSPQGPL